MLDNYSFNGVDLDECQLELINSDDNSLVIAGAGTGKSFSIAAKIDYLINNKKIDPSKILVISFTNNTVNDIKNRIDSRVVVCTFHKIAKRILEDSKIVYGICPEYLLDETIKEYVLTARKSTQKSIMSYLKMFTGYSLFLKSKQFDSFCNMIKAFINIFKSNDYSFRDLELKNYKISEKRVLLIIFDIYYEYLVQKRSAGLLDFDDLIKVSADFVKTSTIDYEYIFIDEFQDTSFIRLKLITSIQKKCNSKIIAVGDDWQSIYRFSGCDLGIFLNFKCYFSNVNTIYLKNTYRNSARLIQIAGDFVMKNKLQIKKELISNKYEKNPIILEPYTNSIFGLKKILNKLINERENDIMIISRNNNDILSYIDDEFDYNNNTLVYKGICIKYYSIHKSKGLEARVVIVLNCNDDIIGIPNKIEGDKIVSKLLNNGEIKYAEERRLFYVALTRCKEKVYLLYRKYNASIFIKEIKKSL